MQRKGFAIKFHAQPERIHADRGRAVDGLRAVVRSSSIRYIRKALFWRKKQFKSKPAFRLKRSGALFAVLCENRFCRI
jgi:hypothetical protein